MSFSNSLKYFFAPKYHTIYKGINSEVEGDPTFLNCSVYSFVWHKSNDVLAVVHSNGIDFFDVSSLWVRVSDSFKPVSLSELQSLFSPYLLDFTSAGDLQILWLEDSEFICRYQKSFIFRIKGSPLEIAWNLQITEKSFLSLTQKFLYFFVPESKTLNVCNPETGAVEKYIEFAKDLKNEAIFSGLSVSSDDAVLGLAAKDAVYVMFSPTVARKPNAVKFEKIIQKKSFVVEGLCISSKRLVILFTSEVLSARLYRVYDVGKNVLLYETQIDKASSVVFLNSVGYPDVLYRERSFRVLGVTGEKDSYIFDKILEMSEKQARKCIEFLRQWSPEPLPALFLSKAIKAEKFYVVKKFLDLRHVLKEFVDYVHSEDSSRLSREKQHLCQLLETLHDAIRSNFENVNKQTFTATLANAAIESVSASLDKIATLHDQVAVPRHLAVGFNKIQCEFIGLLLDFSFDLEMLTQRSQEYISKSKRSSGLSSQVSTRSQTPEIAFLCQNKLEMWRNMKGEDIVEDALVSNLIPLAQVYFKKEREVVMNLEFFKEKGKILLEKLIRAASDFRTIQTVAKAVSVDLIQVLKMQFLKAEVEKIRSFAYSCYKELSPVPGSYESALQFIRQVEKVLSLESNVELPVTNQVLGVGDKKLKLSAEKVLVLTENDRVSVLAELFYHHRDPELEKSITADALWKYLLSRNMVDAIKRWAREFASSVNQSEIDFAKNEFPDWPITAEMVEEIHCMPDNFKEDLMNEFAKYGIFSESEKKDVKLLLKRLEKTESLAKVEALLSLPTAVTTPQEFHKLYVCYCLQNDAEKPLSEHMKRYALTCEQVRTFLSEANLAIPEWFDEFMKLKQWEENPENPLFCYEALLVQLRREAVANDCPFLDFLYGKPMEVIGLQLLEDCLTSTGVEVSRIVTGGLLRAAVEQVPLLNAALRRVESPVLNDCTVYDLLKSCTAIDLGKTFTWRVENRYAKAETLCFPNASDRQLVKDYAYQPKLDYLYYLTNGRPSFAFFKFVSDCEGSSKKSENQTVAAACSVAHTIALREFHQPALVQSCIAFLDMLGKDTTPLRCSIFALEKSYAYLCNTMKERGERRSTRKKELDDEFLSLAEGLSKKNEKAARELSGFLEETLSEELEQMSDSEGFTRILAEWKAYIKFCDFYELVMSSVLLEKLISTGRIVNLCVAVQYLGYDVPTLYETLSRCPEGPLTAHLGQVLKTAEKLAVLSESERKRSKRRLYSGSPSSVGGVSPPLVSGPLPLDFFDVLREAEQAEDSAAFLCSEAVRCRNEAFAVLASGYEGFSFTVGICSAIQSLLQLPGFSKKNFVADDMRMLLCKAVNSGYVAWVAELMETLLPEHPVSYLLDWLAFFFDPSFNHDECLVRYKVFHGSLLNITYDALLNIEPELVSSDWLHTLCCDVVKGFVCSSVLIGRKMVETLELLVEVKFSEYFDGPDYISVTRILQLITMNSCIRPNVSQLVLSKDSDEYKAEVSRLLHSLIAARCYSDALNLAKIVGEKPETVYLSQIENEYARIVNNSIEERIAYWKRSETLIQAWKIKFESLAKFFVDQSAGKEEEEAIYLLTVALKWQRKIKHSEELENKLWRTWLRAHEAQKIINLKEVYGLVFHEGLPRYEELIQLREKEGEVEKFSDEYVQELIGFLLDQEVLRGAVRVERNFGSTKNKDIELILAAISVLDDSAKVEEVISHLSAHLSKAKQAAVRNDEKLVANDLEMIISKDAKPHVKKYITFFHQVEDALCFGQTLMSRIRELYCLTEILGTKYTVLADASDATVILRHILRKEGYSFGDRQKLALCWIHATGLSNDQVIKTVLTDLQEAVVRTYNSGSPEEEDVKRLSFSLLQSMCSHWTGLCCPQSSLGDALLAEGTSADSTTEQSSESEFGAVIEYCILAHTAFSQSCDIEGIGRVLRRAKVLTNTLTRTGKWSLMVRLLTGIQRYSEMSYIFTILHNHDQFEYLLGKGMDRQPQFKVALISFLKKNCAEKTELFRLVALNFHLYDEVAHLWEEEAKQGLNIFLGKCSGYELTKSTSSTKNMPRVPSVDVPKVKKSSSRSLLKHLTFDTESRKDFTVRPETKKQLMNILQHFSHAAEFYIQADMLQKARECTFKAQEVAAQVAVLDGIKPGETAYRVIGLSASELCNLIANSDISLAVSRLLIEANEHHVDLASILWKRYVINGEEEWLKLAGAERMAVPHNLLEDVVGTQETHCLQHDAKERLKKLIGLSDSITTAYNLASRLQLSDVTSKLKSEHGSPYLKDVQLMLN